MISHYVIPIKGKEELSLTEGSLRAPLFWLALPTIFSSLLWSAYDLIDTFWMGNYSSTALAAFTFAGPLIFIFSSLGSGISITGRIIVAQYEGAGDNEKVETAVGQALVFSVLVGVPLAVLGLITVSDVLQVAGASMSVRSLALEYLWIVLLGMPLWFIQNTVSAVLGGWGDTVTPAIIALASVLLNAVLDPLLIFGIGPIPELGIQGAALATLLSQGLGAGMGLVVLIRGWIGLQLHLTRLVPKSSFFQRVVQLGVPASLERTAVAMSVTGMLFVVGRFPASIVAGYGIAEQVLSLMYLPATGIATAATTIVGQNLGTGSPERAQRAAHIAVGYPFVLITVGGGGLFVFAEPIAGVFSSDPTVIAAATEFFQVVAFALGAETAARIYSGVFRGGGRTTLAFGLTSVMFLPVRLSLALVLADLFGATGIWIGYAISGIIGAILGIVIDRWFNWK